VGRDEPFAVTLGSIVALAEGVRAGERWPRPSQHALFLCESGLLVARVDFWSRKLAVEKHGDDTPGYPESAAPRLRNELALTLTDASRLKFLWTTWMKVARGNALARVDPGHESQVMRWIFGRRLSSD